MIVFPSATFLGSAFQIVTICWVTIFFLLSLSWCLRVLDRLMGMHGMEGYELYADGGYLYHVWQRHCRLKGWFLCWFIKLLDHFQPTPSGLRHLRQGDRFFTNYPIYIFLISMCIYQTTSLSFPCCKESKPNLPSLISELKNSIPGNILMNLLATLSCPDNVTNKTTHNIPNFKELVRIPSCCKPYTQDWSLLPFF